jgi:DNA-binding transcriptional regulator of glucitol operon
MAFALAPDMVLAKTDKGLEEISHRSHALSHEMRSALIQVDGRRTVARLLVAWSQWPGFPAALSTLAEQGFIAPVQALAPAAAIEPQALIKRDLVAMARAVLKENGASVVSRLERSADDTPSLRAAVDASYKLVMLTIDERLADAFASGARAILDRAR